MIPRNEQSKMQDAARVLHVFYLSAPHGARYRADRRGGVCMFAQNMQDNASR